jgi:hypothetical protein
MVIDPQKQIELAEKFTDSFSWSGELEFYDEHTLSVKASGMQSGSIHLRRDVLRLEWNIKSVSGDVRFDRSSLTTLAGAPSSIGRDLEILDCSRLETLGGTLDHVARDCDIKNTPLKSLQGGPKRVGRHVKISELLTLETLEGFPSSVGGLVDMYYKPNLGLLRTLVANKIWLSSPEFDTTTVESILNMYAGQGKRGIFKCKKALIEAGFEGNARW